MAKEMLILIGLRMGASMKVPSHPSAKQALGRLIGLRMGASMKVLSETIGISPSALSRRHDAARRKLRDHANTSELLSEIIEKYRSGE